MYVGSQFVFNTCSPQGRQRTARARLEAHFAMPSRSQKVYVAAESRGSVATLDSTQIVAIARQLCIGKLRTVSQHLARPQA
jgi:hypothetical protein